MTSEIDFIFKELEDELDLLGPQLVKWNRQYLSFQRKRYENDLEIVKNYHKYGDILEIGSAPYHFTFCLKKLGYSVIGLDISPERGADFIRKHDLYIIKCDIERNKIPFHEGRFNFIIFNEIFEHLRINPIFALREVNRVLNPDGILILSTPNLYSIMNIIKFILGKGCCGDPYKEFEKLYTLGHMGHVRLYSTKEIKNFLEKTGFKVIKVLYKFHMKHEKNIKNLAERLFCRLNPITRWHPSQVIVSMKKIELNT